MKHTFFLRKPKGEKETIILFSCYFKDEQKQFVYSTRKSILPTYHQVDNSAKINAVKSVFKKNKKIM